jgi:hypothetical protein
MAVISGKETNLTSLFQGIGNRVRPEGYLWKAPGCMHYFRLKESFLLLKTSKQYVPTIRKSERWEEVERGLGG